MVIDVTLKDGTFISDVFNQNWLNMNSNTFDISSSNSGVIGVRPVDFEKFGKTFTIFIILIAPFPPNTQTQTSLIRLKTFWKPEICRILHKNRQGRCG